MQEWGKRRLAYKIHKKQEGNYLVLNFQMDSKQTKKLEQSLRLNDQLLRFLLVNKDAL
jgi:small subunit ribosomal protein S6